MDGRLSHVEAGHTTQQQEVGGGDFLSAKDHAEHHCLADDVEQLVAVALSHCMAVVGVSWWP